MLDLYIAPSIFLSDAVVGVLLLTSAAFSARAERRREGYGFTIPLLLLVGLALGSTATALSPTLALYTAFRWAVAIALYLCLLRSDVPVRHLVKAFLIGLGLQAFIGLLQVLRQAPLGLPGELALPPDRLGAAVIITDGRRWLRAYGLTFHPNVLGGFLAIGLILGLPLLTRWRWFILWWLLSLGMGLSFSRSAWLALMLVLPPTAFWLSRAAPSLRRPLLAILLGLGLIILVFSVVFTEQLYARLWPIGALPDSPSIAERVNLARVALGIIAVRPLIGIGAGNSPLAVLMANVPARPQPIHNVPLLLATEIGVVGGALWLWLWLSPTISLAQRLRSLAPGGHPSPWLISATGAWLALGIIGLWDAYPWALNAGRLLTVVLLGMISRTSAEAT